MAFAHKIFDLFLPLVTEPDFDPAPAPVKDIDPNKLAGLFFNETTGEPLRIAVQTAGSVLLKIPAWNLNSSIGENKI